MTTAMDAVDRMKSKSEVAKDIYGTAAEKQTWTGNCKWITASRKFTVGLNVAKVAVATSSEGFLLSGLS